MGTDDDRLARVEARLDAQQRQIEALLAENDRLRSRVPASASESAHRVDDSRDDLVPGFGRRRLLIGGATAGAAAVAALVGSATPAAAANGSPMALGQTDNAATGTTGLDATVGSGDSALRVTLTGDGTAVEAVTLGTGFGVRGIGGTGVNGAGVYGGGTTGVGVWGASVSEAGVYGESSSNAGLYGVSSTGGGTYGLSDSGLGIYGQSTSGSGVRGLSVAGAGVEGFGATVGVLGDGARANLFLPAHDGTRVAPTSDAIGHARGEVLTDLQGNQWVCVADGTPGKWRKTAGPATAGQLHVLPVPARVADTRPGGVPTSVVPKTPIAAGATRVFDLKVNNSGVPAGATAALLTVLLVNATNGNGNLTVWANGVAKPTANTMVWGAGSGRWTATAVTALDSQARIQVTASAKTDIVLDVVGYYR